MGRFGRAGRVAALSALLLLASCTSLGGLSPTDTAALNLVGTDLSAALFAVDLPLSVEPADPPRVTSGDALDVTLVRADAEAVMGVLPPPAEGRSYAVYGFAPADQTAVRSGQTGLRAGQGAALSVAPRLCATGETKKDRDTVTVLAIVPGQRPIVVAGPETIVALEARTGVSVTPCAGHSG